MQVLRSLLVSLLSALCLLPGFASAEDAPSPRAHVAVRGIYGGLPTTLMEGDKTLPASGVNAIWIGERGISTARVKALRAQGSRVFAEFNTLHQAAWLKEHADARPVGADGEIAEAAHGWQGVCPTHEGYRHWRMSAFRTLLSEHEIDGVWLDYHHAHASWERAEPVLPDTCFCARCLQRFQQETGTDLKGLSPKQAATRLLGPLRETWVTWRCGVFTDWVREFRETRDATRPKALLGTFHCPWSANEYGGALRAKLAIDLRAQSAHIDVFSPMLYHARFGHARDPAWISRQTAWLARHLGAEAMGVRQVRIWPIVQLSDWGPTVPVEQVEAVLDHGTRAPATGVMVFAWGGLRKQPEKVEEMVRVYRGFQGSAKVRPAEKTSIEVRFEPGQARSKLAPRYSPKGYRVPLEVRAGGAPAGLDALEGRLPLGPLDSRGEGLLLVLARSAEGKPFDRLWIDSDGDGSLEDEEERRATARVKRTSVYTSYDALISVKHAGTDPAAAGKTDPEPYPIGLWVAVESVEATPSFIRFSRRGFLRGSAVIGETKYDVVLSDGNNDAIYGTGDWWAVLPAGGGAANDLAAARKVGDFAWAGSNAVRLVLEGTRGRKGRLIVIDPGLTPEEDARARDRFWDDKHAARAREPVPFRHDVEAAMEEAKKKEQPFFLDFETTWCGPCKSMDRWVYSSKDVVMACQAIVCIKVDGDERKDLKEKYSVSAFPTGILLRPGGEEIARFTGYRSVAQMVAFFAKR